MKTAVRCSFQAPAKRYCRNAALIVNLIFD